MNLRTFLKDNLIILDGGMGTLLQAGGLLPGELPERWNLTHPEDIIAIHKAYFDAGSHVVNTNTFGANLFKFSADELDSIVAAATENARKAAAQSKAAADDFKVAEKQISAFGDIDFISIYDADTKKK